MAVSSRRVSRIARRYSLMLLLVHGLVTCVMVLDRHLDSVFMAWPAAIAGIFAAIIYLERAEGRWLYYPAAGCEAIYLGATLPMALGFATYSLRIFLEATLFLVWALALVGSVYVYVFRLWDHPSDNTGATS